MYSRDVREIIYVPRKEGGIGFDINEDCVYTITEGLKKNRNTGRERLIATAIKRKSKIRTVEQQKVENRNGKKTTV